MLTIFGASGRIGGHLVSQALDAGHDVTAVVRGTLNTPAHPRLTVFRANLLDPTAITEAVDGADAVISALGPPNNKPSTINSDGVASIMTAMEKTGTSRLLAVSAEGAFVTSADSALMRTVVKPMVGFVLRNHFRDIRAMEEIVRASTLDWTLVRPPQLKDGPLTRAYRRSLEPLPQALKINRADVADCLLTLAADPSTHRKIAYTAA